MNLSPGFALFGHDPESIIFQNPAHFFITHWSINRVQQTPLNQGQTSASLIIILIQTMTDHTGNALTGCRVPVQIRHKRRLPKIGTNWAVASQTKITIRTTGQLIDFTTQRQVHRTQLRIRMLRNRPLFILLGMTSATGRRRRKLAFGKQVLMFRRRLQGNVFF